MEILFKLMSPLLLQLHLNQTLQESINKEELTTYLHR